MDLISLLILFLSLLASPFHSFVLIPLLIPLFSQDFEVEIKVPPSVEVRPVPHVAFEFRASSTFQPDIPAHCYQISLCSYTHPFTLILPAELELGHLGLRRGSIPKWSGHPHSALSGAANISLYVFA
ncbi:hypothetical protein B0H14DRAFT_2697893 [Mycena olivaceomarginata]|nr:hypothetical protein B0H14DRAFT_2697893 [Mycena olivaceomarginata]